MWLRKVILCKEKSTCSFTGCSGRFLKVGWLSLSFQQFLDTTAFSNLSEATKTVVRWWTANCWKPMLCNSIYLVFVLSTVFLIQACNFLFVSDQPRLQMQLQIKALLSASPTLFSLCLFLWPSSHKKFEHRSTEQVSWPCLLCTTANLFPHLFGVFLQPCYYFSCRCWIVAHLERCRLIFLAHTTATTLLLRPVWAHSPAPSAVAHAELWLGCLAGGG